MSEQSDGGLTPAAAFEALGHETRLAIVEELAKPRRVSWQPKGQSFADLRRAVGVRDAGKFNYHLQEIRPHFVTKYGDQYVLQNAGFYLAGAILAGTYTERVETRRAATDRRCPVCDATIEAIYEYEYFRMECPDHGSFFAASIPPGAVAGRSMDDLIVLANRESRHTVEHARGGVCPHCWGRTATTAPVDSAKYLDAIGVDGDRMTGRIFARFECERCAMTIWFLAAVCVVDHPAVVSLYYRHGIDIRERGHLELDFVSGSNETLISTDPIRIAVEIELDGDALSLLLDEEMTVVDVSDSNGPLGS